MTISLDDARTHSPFSDPGHLRERWDALAPDAGIREIGAVVRNLLFHYRADGIEVPVDRRAEIDSRWAERILACDARRHPDALDVPRAQPERVAGCCRDYTLLTVSALRERGIPARSRIGFAGYFGADYHFDHVVVEFHDDARWVRADAQLDPARFPFDTCDLPHDGLDGFATASEVWQAVRAGRADPATFGVYPGAPYAGLAFIYDYVIREVAHLHGAELLLWDVWGGMIDDDAAANDEANAAWMDELAALVLAADAGDPAATEELAARFDADDRLNPRGKVVQMSPYGDEPRAVDLERDAPAGLSAAQ